MELSERWLKKFEAEGFVEIYEWTDAPGTKYESHRHQGKVSIFVTDGSCLFDIAGVKRVVAAGERFDVPVGVEHAAEVGPTGWTVVVGAEIKGDS